LVIFIDTDDQLMVDGVSLRKVLHNATVKNKFTGRICDLH